MPEMCVLFGRGAKSTGEVRDIIETKPTYGRDGDASPRKLGFSKVVSLLVSLGEPNAWKRVPDSVTKDRKSDVAASVLFFAI